MTLKETIQSNLLFSGIFIVLINVNTLTCAQELEHKPLTELLTNEVFSDLSNGDKVNFQERFKTADMYLRAKLNAFNLEDTTKKFYEFYEKLENLPDSSQDEVIQSERLKYLFLTSIVQPYSCDSLFYQLLIEADVQNMDAKRLKNSLFTYKFWLYNLLNFRFISETDYFEKKITRARNSYLFARLKEDFINVEEEMRLLELSKSLIASEMEYFANDSNISKKMAQVYFRRYLVVMTAYDENKSSQLRKLIIDIANYAIELDPKNPKYHFELSEFYSNETVRLLAKLDYGGMSVVQMQKIQSLAKVNVAKSEFHMEIAKKLELNEQ
ncbi:MAG: hypothetical protein MRY83_02510 [Flavobacteriales bacterium]|nr:hypothetical protein [Flavobacteriales bacterium]